MAGAAADLAEPTVLAHAKQRLFPDPDAPDTYAVTDTQFATEQWRRDRRVAAEVREALAPYNHVRIGSGYPDLVGVRPPESSLLSVDRVGDTPALVVVEAKGHTASGTVDTERGIVQAHDRLGEANAAYLAAPETAITGPDRTLARQLNVGVLGVRADGTVDALETPRVVGRPGGDPARAIHLQATTQGLADANFGLNHPKNYLGYPLAHVADGDTAELLDAYDVVGAVADARRGAAFLDLIAETPRGAELRPLGREVVRFAREREGSVTAALERFGEWFGSRTRFVDLAPDWGQLARRVVYDHDAVELLVTELQTAHDDGLAEPSLVEFVQYLHRLHPEFTVELFLRGDEDARSRVLTDDGGLRADALADGAVYHSPTVFQLKAVCYHAGLLTERGAEPDRLDPTIDTWALRHPVGER
jgi:hypothetical protein